MSNESAMRLKVVDGLALEEKYRRLLKPGEVVRDRQGRARRLPRFFYEIGSREAAREIKLAAHFSLWEFITVDVREAEALRDYPRYVPCAVTVMAAHLELLRLRLGTFLHIASNGGYRSPAHALSREGSIHSWGTAVNIYRIGDDYLDDQEKIERYGRMATDLLPGVWAHKPEYADDHLHLDLGYVTVVPRDAEGENEP